MNAFLGGELAAATTHARTASPEEQRALDASLARYDAERKEDEERARRIAAEHIDPQACELDFHVDVPFCDEWVYQDLREQRAAKDRAADEARRAAESRQSSRPSPGPRGAVASRSRH